MACILKAEFHLSLPVCVSLEPHTPGLCVTPQTGQVKLDLPTEGHQTSILNSSEAPLELSLPQTVLLTS